MKKLFLSAISVVMATGAYAMPHTFADGDIVSAEKMNENFQHLEQQLRGARTTEVNCTAGETINGAIESGYNDITVSGTCNENLLYTVWRDSGVDNLPSDKLAPGYLKITGADSATKIVDTTSGNENTISVNGGATVVLENITISGGKFGVAATRNSNLLMTGGVTIEGFTENGIRVDDSSYLGIDQDGVTITGGTGAVRGIYIGTGSSSWVASATITGVERGFDAFANATIVSGGYNISASKRGIRLNNGHFFQYGGAGVIESTSEHAVDAYQSTFDIWDPATLEIKSLNGGRGIGLGQSTASSINNLKLLNFNNTGSGWNPAIRVGNASALNLNNSEVSGVTDSSLINIDRSSMMEVNNSNISGTAGDALIYAGRESLLDLEDSTVSGTAQALIGIDRGSTLQIESGTLSGTIEDALIGIHRGSSAEIRDESELTVTNGRKGINVGSNSHLDFQNSQITGTVTDRLIQIWGGASAQISDSTIVANSNDAGIGVFGGSGLGFENSSITVTSTVAGSGSVISVDTDSAIEISDGSIITSTSTGVGINVGWNSMLKFRDSTLAGTATDGSLIGLGNGSTSEIRNSTLTGLVSNEDGIRVSGGSRLNFRDSEISCTCTEGTLITISGGSSTEIRDSSLELISGNRGVNVADSSELSFRNSTLSGSANYELVSVTRASNAIIQGGSELSHSNTSEVDIEVSNLSFLSVWDSSVNSVNCYNKGYVSANEGTVTDLATSCTE